MTMIIAFEHSISKAIMALDLDSATACYVSKTVARTINIDAAIATTKVDRRWTQVDKERIEAAA